MKTRTMTSSLLATRRLATAPDSRHPGVNGTKQALLGLALAAAVLFPQGRALAMSVDLASASTFAVLAGAGITVAGATTLTGDMGTFPTATITGVGNLTLNGVNHAGDAIAQAAKSDLIAGYNSAAGRAYDLIYAGGFDLVGQTLHAGVYNSGSSLFLSGTLTLDAQGDPDAVFIFQAGSTLITASASKVVLINGAQARNVIWQVGSSATLGTGTDFIGSILALESITMTTGATLAGQALALNGAVTFDNNVVTVTVPEAGTLHLLVLGAAALVAFRRRRAVPHMERKPFVSATTPYSD